MKSQRTEIWFYFYPFTGSFYFYLVPVVSFQVLLMALALGWLRGSGNSQCSKDTEVE